MLDRSMSMKSSDSKGKRKLRSVRGVHSVAKRDDYCQYPRRLALAVSLRTAACPGNAVVVQPDAPGKPTRTLSPSTSGQHYRQVRRQMFRFMQGMIMHHAQAIEMTALIGSHTENKDLRSLGARISSSQSDETKFMKRWLEARGEPTSPMMPEMPGMDMSSHASHSMLMPGMLTEKQMEALKKRRARSSTGCF